MQGRLHVSLGLCLIALTILMVEVLLIRVFDVILIANMGFIVITFAMFASGTAGVYATIRPLDKGVDIQKWLALLSLLLAVSLLLLRPALNATPLVYELFAVGPTKYLVGLSLMYLVLVVPFFLSGLIFVYLFTAYASRIGSLYFWDLAGAALGCVIFLPFLRKLGPGGLLFSAAAMSLLASALFAGRRTWSLIATVAALGLFVIPLIKTDGYFEFHMHTDKRGVRSALLSGRVELTEWDPISKIDVIDQDRLEATTQQRIRRPKHVAYDGGSQSSHFFPFDGDYERLRHAVLVGGEPLKDHFWHRGVLVSHYLKRDTGAEVLIFGSAAGQETKAALLFNPSRVDGIELVETVVNLGKERYAAFIGHIFNDSRVHNQVGEGRSYLRKTTKKYDIIQIFSNHTSSSIAAGTGATTPVYLQTVEAYREYFSHLKDDGILHINHHFYPRMVTTAARAWRQLGRNDFAKHVLIYERPGGDSLPTMLVKMSPWTELEVEDVKTFFVGRDAESNVQRLVVDPLNSVGSFLSAEFFSGTFSGVLQRQLDYLALPSTDDWPYFNNIQKGFRLVVEDPKYFLNEALVQAINGRLRWPLGEYTLFAAIGGAGLFFSALLIFVPLTFSGVGQAQWPGKYVSVGYFSCLGAGFIIIELVLAQVFMKLVGYPLYTFSSVLGTMLLAAGLGSLATSRFGITPERRWMIPFVGVLASGLTLWWLHPSLFDIFLAAPTLGRVIAAMAMIFPLAFFLGMPFPLGILSLKNQPKGAIAWAWGMNALFTVIGGVAAGILSILIGFRLTLLIAFGIYLLAFLLFAQLRLAARACVQS